MGAHQTMFWMVAANVWCTIKEQFGITPFEAAVFLNPFDQAHFIIGIVEMEAGNFWDQVMTINDKLFHNSPRESFYILIMLWFNHLAMNFKKIFPYLLLNIVLSAVTMLAVILIWNALNPASQCQTQTLSDGSDLLSTEPARLPPMNIQPIEIQSVFLPGDVEYEKVSLKNTWSDPVNLSGWILSNNRGDEFIFPTFTLYPDGVINIYSHAGFNNTVELYWNAPAAVWQPGGVAILTDAEGNERFRFSIP